MNDRELGVTVGGLLVGDDAPIEAIRDLAEQEGAARVDAADLILANLSPGQLAGRYDLNP